MPKMHQRILFILFFVIFAFAGYIIYTGMRLGSTQMVSRMNIDKSSTRGWQDIALGYMINRNSIINGILDGKYADIKKCGDELRSIEYQPLLNGDLALAAYMIKNPNQCGERVENINIEYSEIRKLTKEEVVIAAKVTYQKNGIPVRTDYELTFRCLGDKYLLSKIAFE